MIITADERPWGHAFQTPQQFLQSTGDNVTTSIFGDYVFFICASGMNLNSHCKQHTDSCLILTSDHLVKKHETTNIHEEKIYKAVQNLVSEALHEFWCLLLMYNYKSTTTAVLDTKYKNKWEQKELCCGLIFGHFTWLVAKQ